MLNVNDTSPSKSIKMKEINQKRRLNEIEMNRLHSTFTHGHIRMQNTSGFVANQEGTYYLKFDMSSPTESTGCAEPMNSFGEQIRNIPKFMSTMWNMKSPQIIIPIVTGTKNFKNWKNQKLEESFRRGLIKAANKTEMWFITNGVNGTNIVFLVYFIHKLIFMLIILCIIGGISAMIGEAFNEEKVIF